jgi:hypothetical protein
MSMLLVATYLHASSVRRIKWKIGYVVPRTFFKHLVAKGSYSPITHLPVLGRIPVVRGRIPVVRGHLSDRIFSAMCAKKTAVPLGI